MAGYYISNSLLNLIYYTCLVVLFCIFKNTNCFAWLLVWIGFVSCFWFLAWGPAGVQLCWSLTSEISKLFHVPPILKIHEPLKNISNIVESRCRTNSRMRPESWLYMYCIFLFISPVKINQPKVKSKSFCDLTQYSVYSSLNVLPFYSFTIHI